ncbi:MAG: alpha/beta hydrolase [Lapillicoccus sp.]
MAEPRLIPVVAPDRPEGAALILHGGGSRSGSPMVSPTQLSVLRMKPVASQLASTAAGRLAVFRLLNSHRGWDPHHTPVDDVRWAMDAVRERYGELPLGLVGHSLGGRAALLTGSATGVRSVVALNPWLSPDDRADLSGARVLIVHGDRDRIASPHRARAFAEGLRRQTDVTFVSIDGGKHAMLRHGHRFQRLAADFTCDVLLDPVSR